MCAGRPILGRRSKTPSPDPQYRSGAQYQNDFHSGWKLKKLTDAFSHEAAHDGILGRATRKVCSGLVDLRGATQRPPTAHMNSE